MTKKITFAFHYFTLTIVRWLWICLFVCLFVFMLMSNFIVCFCPALWDSTGRGKRRNVWFKSLSRWQSNCTFWWNKIAGNRFACGKNDNIRNMKNDTWVRGREKGRGKRNVWFESLSSWPCLTSCRSTGKKAKVWDHLALQKGGSRELFCYYAHM